MTTQKELVEAYRHVFMNVPEGQIVLRDMMKSSGLFQITGVRSQDEIQHLEETREMVRRIISLIGMDDKQVMHLGIGVIEDA